MATVLSTLYPPLIDTFMPAFPYDENVTVDFSISPYNTVNMINYLHVSLVNQKTNQNAFEGSMSGLRGNPPTILAGTSLVNGIWIVPLTESNVLYRDRDNLWHLTIPRILLKNQDNDINNKVFTIDYYYKLQLRFDSCTDSTDLSSAAYLTKNRVYFSEWSSVCLLKAIPHVNCFLKNFDDPEAWGTEFAESAVQTPQYTPGSIDITGYLTFTDGTTESTNHGEYLKSFEIQTYDDQGKLIDSITPQFTAYLVEKNDFSYLLDVHNYPTDKIYKLRLIFVTNNNYTFIKDYNFSIINYQSDFSPTWNFKTRSIFAYGTETEEIVTEEDGVIEFSVNCGIMPPGYLYVRRESRLDNWASSDLIKCQGFLEGQSNAIICSVKDDTVASLVGYRYSVQYQTLNNAWTTLRYSQEIYPNFHDILVKRGNKQLAIRYNAQISSMTPVKTRVKIDTLGGKYPKFAENANLNYKQFTINGLITAESDFNRTFLNELNDKYRENLVRYDNNMGGKYMIRNDTVVEKEDGYGTYHEWIMSPDTYTKQGIRDLKVGREKLDSDNYDPNMVTPHDIYPLENWWWEREFREKVIEWLNDGEPKLWRSMTEGNMIVMFDGINLTPNAQLGRRTWNFSATVYEVEDGYNLDTLSSLGIYNVQNDYQENTLNGLTEQIEGTEYNLGQLYRVQGTENGTSIRKLIEEKISALYKGAGSNYLLVDNSVVLNSVKIYFHRDNDRKSTSHWYNIESEVPRLVGDPDKYNGKDPIESVIDYGESVNNNYILGHKLIITPIGSSGGKGNKLTVFVNERGYYQTPAGTNIYDIELYDDQVATIEYFVQWKIKYNDIKDPSSYEIGEEIVGQVSGWWRAGSNINTLIYNKYYGHDITETYDEAGSLNEYIGKTQELEYWKASDFDVTPYAMFNIRQVGEGLSVQKIMVGRTGTLRLETESTFPMSQCVVLGKRMFRASDDRQKYLDEWEYVLDSSVYQSGAGDIVEDGEYWYALLDEGDSYKTDVLVKVYFDADQDKSSVDEFGYQVWDLDDFRLIYDDWRNLGETFYTKSTIKKPEYNTVYGVVDENGIFSYKLYYIDGGWYDVTFEDDSYSTMLAKVPINGVINYRGNLIRKMYT